MKVITVNVNGIRASSKKGLFKWLEKENPDFVCIQETKAQIEQLVDEQFFPKGYHCYYYDAQKKGYSGVAVYSKQKPDNITKGFGFDHITETEGRYLQLDIGDLSVVSLYLPSGSSSDERQEVKFELMDLYQKLLEEQEESGRKFIICGDWNIVHKEIDIKNFKSNQKSSGCLPEERAWLDSLFTKIGFIDAFREVNQEAHQYTWWSNRGQAWQNNVGWRIDYQVISSNLKGYVKSSYIYKEERFSDHAPLVVEYRL